MEKLVISKHTRKWCLYPYLGHPSGCPNYDKKKCLLTTPLIDSYLDLNSPLYAVYSEFNLEEHIRRLKRKHPNWSERQLKCVLYWQGSSRKMLRENISKAQSKFLFTKIITCPEWLGVNVYATLKLAGLYLDKIKSLKICRHVAICGVERGHITQRRLF